MKSDGRGTYVYCLVKSARKPLLARAPRGVPAADRPRLLEGPAGTWIVVADVPLDQYGAATINAGLQDLEWVSERALAHEAVVELFARASDVVPMKLFTIFRNDERARAHVGTARALASVFRRIGGCAEWSVRVSCSPSSAAAVAELPRPQRSIGSGTSFLRRKKSQRDDVRKAAVAAREKVEQVYRKLGDVAKESLRKEAGLPGSHLVLDAAFLVPRSQQPRFEREAARLAASAGSMGCDLVLSGPWPAYHFVGGA